MNLYKAGDLIMFLVLIIALLFIDVHIFTWEWWAIISTVLARDFFVSKGAKIENWRGL